MSLEITSDLNVLIQPFSGLRQALLQPCTLGPLCTRVYGYIPSPCSFPLPKSAGKARKGVIKPISGLTGHPLSQAMGMPFGTEDLYVYIYTKYKCDYMYACMGVCVYMPVCMSLYIGVLVCVSRLM